MKRGLKDLLEKRSLSELARPQWKEDWKMPCLLGPWYLVKASMKRGLKENDPKMALIVVALPQWKEDWKIKNFCGNLPSYLLPQWKEDWKIYLSRIFCIPVLCRLNEKRIERSYLLRDRILPFLASMKRGLKGEIVDLIEDMEVKVASMKRGLKGQEVLRNPHPPSSCLNEKRIESNPPFPCYFHFSFCLNEKRIERDQRLLSVLLSFHCLNEKRIESDFLKIGHLMRNWTVIPLPQWKEDWKPPYVAPGFAHVLTPQWKEDWKCTISFARASGSARLNEKRIERMPSATEEQLSSPGLNEKRIERIVPPMPPGSLSFSASMKRGLKGT